MSAPSGSLARAGSAAAHGPAPAPAPGPAPDAGARTLSNDLGWALGAVFRGYVKAAHEALAGLPGGPRGYQVLAAAAADEHGSQLALAQHLGVDRTVMTYLLDDLEAAGLIERRPDPADRRARRIVATPSGQGTLTGLDQRLRAAEEQLLSGLDTEEDRQVFRSLLRRLAVHASASDPGRPPCGADGTQGGHPVQPC
jgi:DNA-binding MarR family transcriptional regulator